MGRLWNKWLVPALFAVILFLCIRVANDIPKHEYYWESNEWNFMLKDMLVVLFMSYPIFFLLKYWLRLCRKRKLVWWQFPQSPLRRRQRTAVLPSPHRLHGYPESGWSA